MKGFSTAGSPPLNLSPSHFGTIPQLPVNGVELFTLLLAEMDRHARRIVREEHALLLAEQPAAVQDQRDCLTVQQAAKALGMHPQTIFNWIKTGKLQSFRVGRAVRLKPEHVAAALQAHTQPDGRRKYARRGTGWGQRKPTGRVG